MKVIQYIVIPALIVAIIIDLATIATLVYGDYKQSQARKIELVQTVCTIAHNEVSGTSERACSLAQDVTGTEFLCSADLSMCWTESK